MLATLSFSSAATAHGRDSSMRQLSPNPPEKFYAFLYRIHLQWVDGFNFKTSQRQPFQDAL
jgi:hypothetical protein